VNGAAGIVVAPEGRVYSVFGVTIKHDKIVEFNILADPERLAQLDLVVLDERPDLDRAERDRVTRRARARLSKLNELGVLWRSRGHLLGSLPWHDTLDELGAWIMAGSTRSLTAGRSPEVSSRRPGRASPIARLAPPIKGPRPIVRSQVDDLADHLALGHVRARERAA
jgi:hypothetical protein